MIQRLVCSALCCSMVLTMLLGCGVARAEIGILGGMSFPTGSTSKQLHNGFNVGAAWQTEIVPEMGVGVMGLFQSFALKNTDDRHFSTIELLAYGRMEMSSFLLMLGLGVAVSSSTLEDPDASNQTDFAGAVGGGFRFEPLDVLVLFHGITVSEGTVQIISLTGAIWF